MAIIDGYNGPTHEWLERKVNKLTNNIEKYRDFPPLMALELFELDMLVMALAAVLDERSLYKALKSNMAYRLPKRMSLQNSDTVP